MHVCDVAYGDYGVAMLTARILALEPPLSVTGKQCVTSQRSLESGLMRGVGVVSDWGCVCGCVCVCGGC